MKWTKKKPVSSGYYWFQKYKKSKIHLVQVKKEYCAYVPEGHKIIAFPIPDYWVDDLYDGDEDLEPFDCFEEVKNIKGFWSSEPMAKPK